MRTRMNRMRAGRRALLIFCLACLAGLGTGWGRQGAGPAKAAAGWQEAFQEGEIVISVALGGDVKEIEARYQVEVKDQLAGTTEYLVSIPPGSSVEEKLNELDKDRDLLFSRPNFLFQHGEVRQRSQAYIDQRSQAYIDGSSPTLFFGQAAWLPGRLRQAHRYADGAGVRIAVIDTGIDFSHPLFAGRIVGPYYDFVDNDGNPEEEAGGAGYGHGTFVSGLIAMAAPRAMILPLRAFDKHGMGTSFNIAKAIRFAADRGARVVNMSFGLLERDPLIDDAITYAHNRVFQVAAVGNDNASELHFPSNQKSKVFGVASTDAADRRASFSNFGREVQAAAPGVGLYSAYPGGRWAVWSGTSFSTALVSAEAALVLQLRPSLNRSGISRLLSSTGVNLDPLNPGYDSMLGRRIDFLNAVQRAR